LSLGSNGNASTVPRVHAPSLRPAVQVPQDPGQYSIVGLLGEGALGRVYLCEIDAQAEEGGGVKPTLLALKVMSKKDIAERDVATCVKMERDILFDCAGHPYVAQLHAAFSTPSFEYLVMDWYESGSLFDTLSHFDGFRLNEAQARFYFVEVMLGLGKIHELGFVYRDLKPENVLVGSTGHLCIADFDLAVEFGDLPNRDRLANLVGTPEYLAPEILSYMSPVGASGVRPCTRSAGHMWPMRADYAGREPLGVAIDIWCLGCFLFELLHAQTPFRHSGKDHYRVRAPPTAGHRIQGLAGCPRG
jgi:serine/threonine protein kinase